MLGAISGIFAANRALAPEIELVPISPPTPYQSYAYGITYFNSRFTAMGFVPVSQYPSYSYYSDDLGLTWTMTNQGVQAEYRSMVKGPDRVVLTGGNALTSDKNTVSLDGVNWSHYSGMPTRGYWYDTVYDGTYYLASNYSNSTLAQSTDGVTWAARPTTGMPTSTGMESLAYNGDGLYLSGRRGTTNVYRSTDGGYTWSVAGPRPYSFTGLNFENGRFFAQAYLDSGVLASSVDGVTWTTHTMPGTGIFTTPTWVANRGKWVSRANAGGIQSWIVWSDDLVTWHQLDVPAAIQGRVAGLATDGDIVVGLAFVNSVTAYAYRIVNL